MVYFPGLTGSGLSNASVGTTAPSRRTTRPGRRLACGTEICSFTSRGARASARQRADALAPRLVKLQISVPQASRRPGLVVRRDGAVVPTEAFDSPLPVNPGKYTIDAAAPGSQLWSTTVDASKPGEVVTVAIPALVDAAPPVEPKPSHSPPGAVPAARASPAAPSAAARI